MFFLYGMAFQTEVYAASPWAICALSGSINFLESIMFLIKQKEVCQFTGKSRATIWRWTRNGNFPRPLRIGPNSIAWTQEQLDAWLADKSNSNGGIL